jgi:hypothetical protein
MAPGADLIVARAAVEAGAPVEAVLPMPLAHYLEDFDAGWRAELEALLAHPLVRRIELTPAGNLGERRGRDASYRSLGAALARRSSLLLAVWDGHSTRLPGGTSDTVLHYLGCPGVSGGESGEPAFVTDGDAARSGGTVVYWVPVRRSGTGGQSVLPEACFLTGAGRDRLQMHAGLPDAIAADWGGLDRINRDYQRLLATGAGGPRSGAGVDPGLLQVLDRACGIAGSLARYYAHPPASRRLLRALAALRGRRDGADREVACRTLAEILRVRAHLVAAGAAHRVVPQEWLALSAAGGCAGSGWICAALRSVEPTDAA